MTNSTSSLRTALLASASALALSFGLPTAGLAADLKGDGMAPPPPRPAFFVSLEGGNTCVTSDGQSFQGFLSATAGIDTSVTVNGNDCNGWTGRVGIGQEGKGILGGHFDYWGVFVRYSDFGTRKGSKSGASPAYYYYGLSETNTASTSADRTVIDFEVGRDVGVGATAHGNATWRIFGGLRYARFDSTTRMNGALTFSGYYYSYTYRSSVVDKSSFDGFGPRIGMSFKVPFGRGWGLTATGSASVLFGERTTNISAVDVFGGTYAQRFSSDDHVVNFEGEAGVYFSPFGPRSELVLGARAEHWADQIITSRTIVPVTGIGAAFIDPAKRELDHTNWGLFARMKIKLGD